MSCTSGCPTPGAHESWGACLKAKAIQFTEIAGHMERKAWDAELSAYASARKQGMQPRGTRMKHVEEITQIADKTGVGNPWQ